MDNGKIFKVAPSGVDYALKCKRCLWLACKGIKLDAFFPPIFNAFDRIQKKFLLTQSVKIMSNTLPDGRIMTELNGLIASSTLKDKKGRLFIISGRTDVVVEFNTRPKKYGIIDLKTTSDIKKFRNSAYRFNYDSQAYIYNQLFEYEMLFIVIDKSTHQVGLFDCSPQFYESGKDKVRKAVEVYDLFFKTEDFDPKQYFINETL